MSERMGRVRRFAIVNDAKGLWYVRRLYSSMHDLDADHKIYRCDKHLGGPYETLAEAFHLVGVHSHAPRQKKAKKP